MGKVSRIVCASILLAVSAQGKASGINVLSEEHLIWGEARLYPSGLTLNYEQSSDEPINFSTKQISIPGQMILGFEAEAGDFQVLTKVGLSGVGNKAFAQSTYTFTPEWTQLSLRAFGQGGDYYTYDLSEAIVSLLDVTSDKVLLSENYRETPDLAECPPYCSFIYDFDESYLFDVNPSHTYELNIFAKSLSFQVARTDTALQTELSAVPIPAAFWLFGTALLGLVGFSKRRKTA